MQVRRAYFRQEQAFRACLPLVENHKFLKEISKRNVLTSGLVATYPFISSAIFDEDGIFIGTNIYNNSLVFIDRYNTNKYKNANMCILVHLVQESLFTQNYLIDIRIEINGDRAIYNRPRKRI